jgi:hypothetical protein
MAVNSILYMCFGMVEITVKVWLKRRSRVRDSLYSIVLTMQIGVPASIREDRNGFRKDW